MEQQQGIHNTSPMVEITTASTGELARLISIQDDLDFVIESTQLLAGFLEQEDQHKILIRSLYTTAVITYCRCFASGKRSPLTMNAFSDLPTEAKEAHKYFKAMRDKHIAHSVNRFEAVKIGVVLNPASLGPPSIIGHGYFNISRYTDGAETIQTLFHLATHARSIVESQRRILFERVKDEAISLDITKLYSNTAATYVAPGIDDAGKAR